MLPQETQTDAGQTSPPAAPGVSRKPVSAAVQAQRKAWGKEYGQIMHEIAQRKRAGGQ